MRIDVAPERLNAFSVDLEDWFCVANMEAVIPLASWPQQELRVERTAEAMLQILAFHKVRATFFVLGWIAERCPGLVRKIYAAGHEIGLHGYAHQRLTTLSPTQFAEELRRAFAAVSRVVPRGVVGGYRAPSFTVTPRTSWAFQSLRDAGLRYDSSVVPVRGHPDYGWADAPRGIHRRENGLIEVPLTAGVGGGYFRLFPYAWTRFLIRRANAAGRPAIFYIHPWELDADQPRIPLPPVKRFRHYVNLSQTIPRLKRLLTDFRFGPISEVLAQHGF